MARLQLLDYGRFIAAFVVVLFHLTFNGIVNGKIDSISYYTPLIQFTKYGYLGVEFFFMISGYVIFFSAQNSSPSKFVVSRALRLYPAYWFAVLFTASFAFFWGGEMMSVYLNQVLANLTMLQSFIGVHHVDGVYWTLVYELQFYFAVFLLLLLGFGNRLRIVFMLWPILFLIAFVLKIDSAIYLGGYFYYFSAGTILAMMRDRVSVKEIASLLAVFALALNFSVTQANIKSEITSITFSPIIIVTIVTLCFLFFLIQNSKKVAHFNLPLSKQLGALTYPIYLIHAHFGYMLLSKFASEDNKIYVYFMIIPLILIISFVLNWFVEIKLHTFWKKLFNFTLPPAVKILEYLLKYPLRELMRTTK